jgi:hypothetical protein
MGPQIAERLFERTDAIEALNKLPPAEVRRQLTRLEGILEAEQRFAAQNGYAPQPRRVSAAPPPFKSPRGAANPPSDIRQLAQRENATDYIRARQAQEKRRG